MNHAAETSPRGLRAITIYKLVRGALMLLFAIACFAAALFGHGADELLRLAVFLRAHASHGLSATLATLLSRAAEGRHLLEIAAVLALDGALTTLEGWSLRRGWRWGPWLVVVATSALLPVEILAIAHHPTLLRAAVMIGNAAIVAYLVSRLRAEARS